MEFLYSGGEGVWEGEVPKAEVPTKGEMGFLATRTETCQKRKKRDEKETRLRTRAIDCLDVFLVCFCHGGFQRFKAVCLVRETKWLRLQRGHMWWRVRWNVKERGRGT